MIGDYCSFMWPFVIVLLQVLLGTSLVVLLLSALIHWGRK